MEIADLSSTQYESMGSIPGLPPILAVIPAYNESEHIVEVVCSVQRFLPVLVVDDGSMDQTAQLAEAAGAAVLRQVPNQGKGAALIAGFRRALELGYEAVIMLDADGQHDPSEIPEFEKMYIGGGSDLIIGRRSFKKMPLIRRLSNTVGRWLFSWALGRDIPDNQSGYRMVSRRLMEAVIDSRERGFEFEVEMIATCLKKRYALDWVPIQTVYAGETSHIQPFKHAINYFRVVFAARRKLKGVASHNTDHER